jgi:hypothetical protein
MRGVVARAGAGDERAPLAPDRELLNKEHLARFEIDALATAVAWSDPGSGGIRVP